MGKVKNKNKLEVIKTLPVKQQKFVHEKVCGKTDAQAIIDAGYDVKSTHVANVMGQQLLSKPAVRTAISTMVEEQYPHMKKLATLALERILKGTTTQPIDIICPHCQKESSHEIEMIDASKDSAVLKAIDTLCKITGDFAPSKSAKLVANLDKYKLPEE
jgi:phage terminase small subunit